MFKVTNSVVYIYIYDYIYKYIYKFIDNYFCILFKQKKEGDVGQWLAVKQPVKT